MLAYSAPLTAIVRRAEKPIEDWYLQPLSWLVDIIIKNRRKKNMVDLEKIKIEIEALKNLNAEEYCKDAVAKIYADFEATRETEIAKLENALEIFDKYQIVEEEEQAPQEVVDEFNPYEGV